MNRHERGLEFKVGIFVFVGLAMLAALVVQFGRLGEGFKTYYTITVRFSDAGGLLKGTDVLLAGARIGKVAGGPKLVREGDGVAVPLKIYDYIKIPEGTKFTVGSSGLLGDRFVNVTIPPGPPKAYLPPNADVNGARETGIDDLTRSGGALVNDLRGTVQKIDTTVTRLNQDTLSPANMENLEGEHGTFEPGYRRVGRIFQETGWRDRAGRFDDGLRKKSRGRFTECDRATRAKCCERHARQRFGGDAAK